MKTSRITDITELGKHSDPMQKFLFGESKAKELNFVGELAEKVSKAIQPSSKKTAYKKKMTSRGEHSSSSVEHTTSASSTSVHPSKKYQNFKGKNSSTGNQYFRKGPSQGKPYLGGKGQRQQDSQTHAKDRQSQQR